MIKILIIILSISILSHAHLCIIDPPQRGDLKYDIPGEEECFRPYSQCGKQSPQTPTVKKVAGSTDIITFQQNFNHWFDKNPGFFDVAISYKVDDITPLTDADFQPLYNMSDFPAHEMVHNQNFTVLITWPRKTCSHCVLRVRYVTNNPDEASKDNPTGAFYQCVDIQIVSQLPEEKNHEKLVSSHHDKKEREIKHLLASNLESKKPTLKRTQWRCIFMLFS